MNTDTDFAEGMRFSFTENISEDAVDSFAELTGDRNPLHMDAAFAVASGFERRVVHGFFLGGLVSRLVGMYCPGEKALLQSSSLRFHTPVHVGDTVTVSGVIDSFSPENNVVILKIEITDAASGTLRVSGKAQAGILAS